MNYMSNGNFNFSANYNSTLQNPLSNSVTNYSAVIPPPPDEGYFLELAGPPFLLLNGQNMTLL